MVLVAYAGPVRPAAALRDSVLCLPTDIQSLFVNKPPSSSSSSSSVHCISFEQTFLHLLLWVARSRSESSSCATCMRFGTHPACPRSQDFEAGPHPFASLSQADACRIAAVGIALRLLASLQSLRCPLASEALPRMATLVASTHMTKINRKAFPWLSISVQGRVAAQECEIPQRRSSTAGALADAGVEGRQGRFVSETGREEVCEALHHGPPGELRLGRLLRGRHCVSEAGTCGCLKYGRGTRVPPCMYHLPGRPFSQGPTMRDSPPPLVRKTWQAEEAPGSRHVCHGRRSLVAPLARSYNTVPYPWSPLLARSYKQGLLSPLYGSETCWQAAPKGLKWRGRLW